MANEEQVRILRQGVEAWNRWVDETYPPRPKGQAPFTLGPDFWSADFRKADLSGANLVGAWLAHAQLQGVNLQRAKLASAVLASANLDDANLADVDLKNSWAQWAKFNRAILSPMQAQFVSFEYGEFVEARLTKAWAPRSNFRGANLERADMREICLWASNLAGANLSGADLSGADLRETNFQNANLHETNFSGAHLRGTIFGNVDLSTAKGLDACRHTAPSVIDFFTLQTSSELPLVFLQGCGLPQAIIDSYPAMLKQDVEYFSAFISYSHKDEVFVDKLYPDVKSRGVICYLDKHNMLPGDEPNEDVPLAIRAYDKLLLCCSKHSLTESWWVDREIAEALAKEARLWRERGRKIRVLIPIDLDGFVFSDECTIGHREVIKNRIAARMKGWQDDPKVYETEFERLIRALRSDEFAREPLPAPKL